MVIFEQNQSRLESTHRCWKSPNTPSCGKLLSFKNSILSEQKIGPEIGLEIKPEIESEIWPEIGPENDHTIQSIFLLGKVPIEIMPENCQITWVLSVLLFTAEFQKELLASKSKTYKTHAM